MSVSNLNVGQNYVCNGAVVTFAINFDYVNASEVVVYLYDATDGSKSKLVQLTDYVIVGASVTTVLAYPAGKIIRVVRETVVDQPTEYDNNTGFNAEDHELSLDHGIRIAQENADAISKSLRMNQIQGAFETELPYLEPNMVLIVGPTGDRFIQGPTLETIEDAAVAAAAAQAAAAAAAQSAIEAEASNQSALDYLNQVINVYNEAMGNIDQAMNNALDAISDLSNASVAEITNTYIAGIEYINFAIVTGYNTIQVALGQALTQLYSAQAAAVATIQPLVDAAMLYAQQALNAAQDVENVYTDLENLLNSLPPVLGDPDGGGANSMGVHFQEYIEKGTDLDAGANAEYAGLTQPVTANSPLAVYSNGSLYVSLAGLKYSTVLRKYGSRSHVIIPAIHIPGAGQELMGMYAQSTQGLSMPLEYLGNGNGLQVTWPLAKVAVNPAFVSVYLNGRKAHSSTYSATANDVTFNVAPPAGTSVAVKYEEDLPSTFHYRFQEFDGLADGVLRLFGSLLFDPCDKDCVIVSVNGGALPKGYYDLVGLDVVFKTGYAPLAGSSICVEYYYGV